MYILLFVVYFLILAYCVQRLPFFRRSGLSPRSLLIFFALRVITGCLHNWIAWRYYPGHGDIWAFYETSFRTRYELFNSFTMFVADNSDLTYLGHNTIAFFHLLFNFFSFDNLYINTLLFSFLAFWGNIALFRTFTAAFPDSPLSSLITLILPSTLFWTSCVHTEGLIYMLLGLFLYHMSRMSGKHFLLSLIPLLLALFFRITILPALIPALICWIACYFHPPKFIRTSITIGICIVIIAAMIWPAGWNKVLLMISERQAAFQALEGNSRVYLPTLQPTWTSLLATLPAALMNGLLQPLPGTGGQIIYIAFSLELICTWLLIGYSLLRPLFHPRYFPPSPVPGQSSFYVGDTAPPGMLTPQNRIFFSAGCLLFSFIGMLSIGYIIPFVGAIVRYRSIFLPFLLAPFLYRIRSYPFFFKLDARLQTLLFKH